MESLEAVKPSLIDVAFEHGMVQVREEIEAFVEFLRPLKLRNMLEIGSESGGTFYLWCRVVCGLKISLDLPNGESGSGRFVDRTELAARNQKMRSWAPNVYLVNGDSHSADARARVMGVLAGQMLDFLFIDGDHSYEGVKQDFETYSEFVRKGGLIAFHDIKDNEHHRIRGCYVANFWAELQGEKREFVSECHWGGIGVLRV
jgi:cephalosporin hydroxylase